jgi:hypothetical protein
MKTVSIPVEDGAIPTLVVGADAATEQPAIFVVPSIFGPAPDLIERLSEFAVGP